METKPTKKELYLQRLEQWRSERAAKKMPLAEIKGNRQVTVSSQVKGKPKKTSQQNEVKPTVSKQKLAQEPKKQMTSAPSHPREAKPTTQEPKKYIAVKSRLFDYLNKSAKKPSDNVKTPANEKRSNALKMKQENKTAVSVKAGAKRRHSEISRAATKKPAGILKRKSCVPSIDMCGDNEAGLVNSNIDKDCNDDNVFLSRADTKKDIPVAMVTPGTARSVRFISPEERSDDHGSKLRKTPMKPTQMRDQLNNFLQAKGRTPSKFRHLMCFHDELEVETEPQTKPSLSVEELSEQMDVILLEEIEAKAQEKLATMLEECMTLFEAGCPVKAILPWLDDIYKNIPQAKTSAKFYECKANVIKSTLDLDALLEIFETAFINNAQPREEIAKMLSESVKYVNNEQLRAAKKRKGTPRRSGIQEENMFQSSAIVYTVSEVTPFSDRKPTKESGSSTGDNCKVITPVRRSTRRSLQNLPSSLKDKKDSYKSLSELEESKKDNMLFQPNMALDSLLAQVEVN